MKKCPPQEFVVVDGMRIHPLKENIIVGGMRIHPLQRYVLEYDLTIHPLQSAYSGGRFNKLFTANALFGG